MARPLTRYSIVAILLHWLIAALILFNLWLGLSVEGRHGAAKINAFELHQSIGMTVLALSILRLGWRLANPPPPEAPGIAHWEKSVSGLVHGAFYVIMIGMPLTGWLMVSAGANGAHIALWRMGDFQGIAWPRLPLVAALPTARREAVQGASFAVHTYLSYGAYVLILLHITGALKHQIFDPNPVLPRMLPFLKRRSQSP